MENQEIGQRLAQLRQSMQKAGADYYYVPAADPHRNEYVPEHWQRRRWISGFTGSAGDALIGLNQAYLWTDPRYFLQAEQELDPAHYQLMKATQGFSQQFYEWLLEQADGFCFAVDPHLVSIKQADQLRKILAAKKGRLLFTEENWIDALWQDQPPLSTAPMRLYDHCYAGCSAQEKITKIQTQLHENHAEALIINDLASIAWLFNIRGQDIDYNPLVIARAVITNNQAHLFIDSQKFLSDIEDYCEQHPYEAFATFIKSLKDNVWLDADSGSEWINQHLQHANRICQPCPIPALKAVKNPTEIAGMKRAHIEDALALVRFFHWLENHWQNGINELSAAEQLNRFRRENPKCVDLSFTTISGFAANGAIIHYAVSKDSSKVIDDSSLYLVDSGGQYLEGTTDVTRTIHLGAPSTEQRRHYTLVLKGHLQLRHTIFPHGTCGEHLNAIAHLPLWRHYLDFGHGTGHGVGCYSCVHESPPRISAAVSNAALVPGMVVSNEPGIYFNQRYGIRIENLCLVTLAAQKEESDSGHGPFYRFEDLTLFPYCRKLIDKNQLSAEEIQMINDYHQQVYDTLIPELSQASLREWLQSATRAL